MTGNEMKAIRQGLSEALGRRLSLADMAKLCGLAPANGADTYRKWEDGDGPSGPVAMLLELYASAVPARNDIEEDIYFRDVMRAIIMDRLN
jgi:hypothetical protein